MTDKIKLEFVSFAQTFVSSLLSILGVAVFQVSPEVLANPNNWVISAIGGAIFAAVRSALKVAWEKTLPVSIGGKV